MLEDTGTDSVLNEEQASKLKLALDKFTFQSPQASPVQRSARTSCQSANLGATAQIVSETSATVSKKRAFVATVVDSPTKMKKNRGYAGPETYAHLDYLTDCLGEYLDVLFCGINPGVLSATVGHHFAHPGNRFYKMLHGSGFTDRLILPEEDSTLPALYHIGIEGELSSGEMIESVPSLLQKVDKYKPRFVCFIGKGMAEKVEKGFKRAIASHSARDAVKSPRTSRKQKREAIPTKHNGKNTDSGIGLRPYKVTHANTTTPVRETLFFCSHSSSGLATSMTLQGKIDVLKDLRELVAKHKAGTLSTSSIEVPFDRTPQPTACASANQERD